MSLAVLCVALSLWLAACGTKGDLVPADQAQPEAAKAQPASDAQPAEGG
jgi:predicted small lipoprotein YifL